METGDVVLTPGWCWHAHGHDGDRPAYWFDGRRPFASLGFAVKRIGLEAGPLSAWLHAGLKRVGFGKQSRPTPSPHSGCGR